MIRFYGAGHGCQDCALDRESVWSRAPPSLHRVGAVQTSQNTAEHTAHRGRAWNHEIGALFRNREECLAQLTRMICFRTGADSHQCSQNRVPGRIDERNGFVAPNDRICFFVVSCCGWLLKVAEAAASCWRRRLGLG